jgi:hypothetical protein
LGATSDYGAARGHPAQALSRRRLTAPVQNAPRLSVGCAVNFFVSRCDRGDPFRYIWARPEAVLISTNFDYATCVKNSEKVAWRLDDVMPEGTKLDFSRPFLPEQLAPTTPLAFLSADERRKLNQISGNSYLNVFQFVEEFILATMTQHAEGELFGDRAHIRALVRMVDEEVKHQELFKRYRVAFDRDFGHACPVLESAAEVAGVVLSKSPIAVMITTLHIELMTLAHYTESVKDDTGIDPFFVSLLKNHWLEESQHAKIDLLELLKLTTTASPEMLDKGFGDYLDIIGAFDGLLLEQAKMDASILPKVIGRDLSPAELDAVVKNQHAGYRKTFLVYGMTNASFKETTSAIAPAWGGPIADKAKLLQEKAA